MLVQPLDLQSQNYTLKMSLIILPSLLDTAPLTDWQKGQMDKVRHGEMETCALFPIRGGEKRSLEMMLAESDPQQLTRS